MKKILSICNDIYKVQPCCHGDGRACNCYNCLRAGFYSEMPDTYECLKKLYYYVMNYGPAYASEIYHYLSKSQILENNFAGKSLRIISLGCGFSPDFIALVRYIDTNNLKIKLTYIGLDIEPSWNKLRVTDSRAQYFECDLLSGFDLTSYNLVFINKLYSTLKQNNNMKPFMDILIQQIKNTLPSNSFLVFNDINHLNMGRDKFDSSIKDLFRGNVKGFV